MSTRVTVRGEVDGSDNSYLASALIPGAIVCLRGMTPRHPWPHAKAWSFMRMTAVRLKQTAGELAAGLVESCMIVGLGTRSTAIFATRRIAERLRTGELGSIVAVATSSATAAAARELGITMLSDDIPRDIDLTIDGADEVDSVDGSHQRRRRRAAAREDVQRRPGYTTLFPPLEAK